MSALRWEKYKTLFQRTIFRWEEYKQFFQITIFRYLVLWFSLVPIIAGMIENLPKKIDINMGGTILQIELSLPFTWQLLWMSSLFFAIAFSIYAIRCPNFIRKYNSYKDYQAFSHDVRWMSWEASRLLADANDQQKDKLIERLTTKNYLLELTKNDEFTKSPNPVVEEKQTVLYFEHKGKKYKLGMPVLDGESSVTDSEKGVFYELFGRYSESRKLERTTIIFLLILSLILFVFVLFQHVFSGLCFVYNWINGMIECPITNIIQR
jgi:hypothetical protein